MNSYLSFGEEPAVTHHQENTPVAPTRLLVHCENLSAWLDLGALVPQLWNEVLRQDLFSDSCYLGGNMHMVNITHTSGILPLYPIIFVIYECIVSPSSQMSNRFTVCKVSWRKVSRKEVRFEIPLTANKNEINMQTFLLHYCKRDISRSAQLLLRECDLTHCRKSEYLKPLVSSLLL